MSKIRVWPLQAILNGVLLLALAWVTTRADAQAKPEDVIRARLIELVNERGEMRAQLYLGESGGGELRLRSGQGDIRVKLGAIEDGAILLLMDRHANPAVRLASEIERPSLRIGPPDRETVIGPIGVSPLSNERK
ncbi:hypothetical protein [Hyphomicrobium sp.]|uniref:hypothetical protein n=1 Tax=Hyphomicrobium sp. TaxID=82 RepID=UPI0025BEA795|nr:hypothetical protein [Hyphomicrobium sp.]MCC7253320.1 hypothetical protein [Hyphomicrobium sp.]